MPHEEEKHGLERNVLQEARLKIDIEELDAEEKRLRIRRDEIHGKISESEWQELRNMEKKLERESLELGVQRRILRDRDLGIYEDKY